MLSFDVLLQTYSSEFSCFITQCYFQFERKTAKKSSFIPGRDFDFPDLNVAAPTPLLFPTKSGNGKFGIPRCLISRRPSPKVTWNNTKYEALLLSEIFLIFELEFFINLLKLREQVCHYKPGPTVQLVLVMGAWQLVFDLRIVC